MRRILGRPLYRKKSGNRGRGVCSMNPEIKMENAAPSREKDRDSSANARTHAAGLSKGTNETMRRLVRTSHPSIDRGGTRCVPVGPKHSESPRERQGLLTHRPDPLLHPSRFTVLRSGTPIIARVCCSTRWGLMMLWLRQARNICLLSVGTTMCSDLCCLQ